MIKSTGKIEATTAEALNEGEEMTADEIEGGPAATQVESAKSLLAIWHVHFWDSSKLLAQGWAFYLTIMAALVGFVVSHPLPPHIRTGLLRTAMAITVMHIIGATIWGVGLLKIVDIIDALCRELDAALCQRVNLHKTFVRWRVVQVLVMVVSAIIGVIIVIGLALLGAQ